MRPNGAADDAMTPRPSSVDLEDVVEEDREEHRVGDAAETGAERAEEDPLQRRDGPQPAHGATERDHRLLGRLHRGVAVVRRSHAPAPSSARARQHEDERRDREEEERGAPAELPRNESGERRTDERGDRVRRAIEAEDPSLASRMGSSRRAAMCAPGSSRAWPSRSRTGRKRASRPAAAGTRPVASANTPQTAPANHDIRTRLTGPRGRRRTGRTSRRAPRRCGCRQGPRS